MFQAAILRNKIIYLYVGIAVVLVVAGAWAMIQAHIQSVFDGNKAYQDVVYQVSLGPRVPQSQAHSAFIQWITGELTRYHWQVEVQKDTSMGHPIENVVARRGSGKPWIILGAHYDSRLWADQDLNPSKRQLPVPGADDGASGVAVLVELARILPLNTHAQIWLAFFDAEDNGEVPGWDWLLGSKVFVSRLPTPCSAGSCPDAVVVVDMVGDSQLDIYEEKNSNPDLTRQIWTEAASLGYSSKLIPQPKYAMLDDHTPFLEAGIPAVDLIDFDYPYWHTTQDTPDKVSADSLKVVGQTLLAWLLNPAEVVSSLQAPQSH